MTPSPRRRLRAAYALLAVPVVLATLTTLSPAKAAITMHQETKSSVTKLYPGARLTEEGALVQLIKIRLESGYSYHVSVPTTVKLTTPDRIETATVSLVCQDASHREDAIQQGVNLIHGGSFTLQPRLYINMPFKPGNPAARGICVGIAHVVRIKGVASAAPSTRYVSVVSAKIVVDRAPEYASAKETIRYKGDRFQSSLTNPFVGHSSRVSPHVHYHAAPVAFTMNPALDNSLALTGDVYLTGCTGRLGSRDVTTNYKELCPPVVVKGDGHGPLVRTRIVIQQYQADGVTPCRLLVVPGSTKTFRITPLRHHLPVYSQGNVVVPMRAGCGSHATAWTEVFVEMAPSVVVKFPNSVTSVVKL